MRRRPLPIVPPNPPPAPEPEVLDEWCDRCGARAKVVVSSAARRALTLCGHHFAEHEIALRVKGWRVELDTR